MRITLLILFFSFGLLSCAKEATQEQDAQDFAVCHQQLGIDSLNTLVKLQGTWHLKKTTCYPGTESRNTDAKFYVTFKNSNFVIVEKGKVISSGRFELLESTRESGRYLLKPQVIDDGKTGFITGAINFCGDEMMLGFAGSNIDGCNYYYEQK